MGHNTLSREDDDEDDEDTHPLELNHIHSARSDTHGITSLKGDCRLQNALVLVRCLNNKYL